MEGEEEGGCEVSFAFSPKRRRWKRGGGREEQKADFLPPPFFSSAVRTGEGFSRRIDLFLDGICGNFSIDKEKYGLCLFFLFLFAFCKKILLIYETVCFALETKN